MREEVTLWGGGLVTTTLVASDRTQPQDVQRYELWGQVVELAERERSKYLGTPAGDHDAERRTE